MKKINTEMKAKIKYQVKKWVGVILNPRLLLCFLLAWMITNGWCYVLAVLGAWLDIPWMTVAGGTYMGLLWLPFTPEKLITLIIAIFLMKKLFPDDKKTIGTLHDELSKLKQAIKAKREKRREKSYAKKSRLKTVVVKNDSQLY